MTEQKEKKVKKSGDDDVWAKLRALEEKVERHSANWRKFAEIHVGKATLILLLAFGLVGIANANLINLPTASGGTGFYVDTSGNGTFGGTVTSSGAMTITSGGLTVTAGGITVTAGGVTVTAGGLTVTAGGATITAGGLDIAAGDLTLANDETIDNATDAKVRVTFNDDATTLGTLQLTSENAVGSLADNDLIEVIMQAYDSATNVTDYAVIQFKATDVTTTTENGQIILQTTANGTDVTGLTIGHNAGGTHACAIVPNTTITGTLTVNGASISGDNATTIGSISNITMVSGAALEVNGNVVLANDETIDNATDAEVRITADDDAVLLLELALESDNAVGNIADNDLMSITATFYDDATNKQEYASIDFKATDVSTTTEDSQIILNYLSAGAAKAVTIGSSAGGTIAMTVSDDMNIDGVGTLNCDTIEEDGTAGVAIEGMTLNDGTFTDADGTLTISNQTVNGEITLDGKYATVGPDATTGLMILSGSVTSAAAGMTNAFATAFGAAPVVICTYTESTTTNLYVSASTTTNFIAFGEVSKNYKYIAIGQRP